VKSFQFRLDKVLDWRRTQLELEEVQYKRQVADLAALDRQRAELEASGIRAEIQVREWRPIVGGDLAALDGFRSFVKTRESQIARQRFDAVRKLEEQQKKMLQARRRCRLLERLKEKRLAEWTKERDRELEELASESYLARWSRDLR
jgi:flagellar protein FliJ